MARDKAIPGSGADFEAGPGSDSGSDSGPGFGIDAEFDLDLERAFRRRLDDELAHQGSRSMAEVVARAASRGRRRVLIRTGGIVASVAAVVVIGGAATVAVDNGDAAPEQVATPASVAARPNSATADGRTDLARTAIARDLGEVLTGLLPEGSWSAVRIGYDPDTGISAEVTREGAFGSGGVVSVSLRPGDLADCPSTLQTPAERTDEFGLKHSIKCVAPGRDGKPLAMETVLGPDGVFRAQGRHVAVGTTVLRLIWANGPLDGKMPQNAKPRPPLTDEEGAEISRSARWEPVARRLPEPGVGAG
ncbi:hypothetical protein [Embleya scabrispora]|uniref:hypothetical protein n=1 Tax=Embleya scabrispora TaxID=159449 RepID=UPI00131A265A|nr:hypothetical protein [Embleya scabrispora]MYS82609.1 hypothetical protein [Streptomyces sp. SID5474]